MEVNKMYPKREELEVRRQTLLKMSEKLEEELFLISKEMKWVQAGLEFYCEVRRNNNDNSCNKSS